MGVELRAGVRRSTPVLMVLLAAALAQVPFEEARPAPAALTKEVVAAIKLDHPLEILTTSRGNRFFFRHPLSCSCNLKTEVVCVKDLDTTLREVTAIVAAPKKCPPNAGCSPGETRAFVVCTSPGPKN